MEILYSGVTWSFRCLTSLAIWVFLLFFVLEKLFKLTTNASMLFLIQSSRVKGYICEPKHYFYLFIS